MMAARKTSGKKLLLALVAGFVMNLAGFPVASGPFLVSSAAAGEEEVYLADEIDFHFAQERNMHHFTMLSGKLVDLVREQGRIFNKKNAAAENGIAPKVEEYINEANELASLHNYEDAFKSLKRAYAVLQTSMEEMGVEKSNAVPSQSNWKIHK